MNYLAHLLLSPGTPLFLAGALGGDFVRGRLPETMARDFREGIQLHRAVDAFADSHPAWNESRRRLASDFGHHARIIVDVFYDHLLAIDFDRYSDIPLPEFAERTYAALDRCRGELPPRLSIAIERMIEHDWLQSYIEMSSIRQALFYLSRRLKRPVALDGSIPLFERSLADFAGDFRDFFPAVQEFARDHRPVA